MKRLLTILMLCVIVSMFSGCIAIHSVGISDIDPKGGAVCEASVTGTGWLTLIVPDQKALELKVINELKQKGATKNIVVRVQMRNIFGIAQLYQVYGYGEK